MKRYFISVASTILFGLSAQAQVKILFDATKAEMSGTSADWVIDADVWNLNCGPSGTYIGTGGTHSNPQRFPTPAQSGVTAGTAENYWTGSLSYWAIDLVNKGYEVETLPYNGSITYGNTGNAQDLTNYKVFIVCEPNIRFNATEQAALMQFVQNGGGLFMISDHAGSDRNNDGWDSPGIWNDFARNNGVAYNPFGIMYDSNTVTGTFNNIITSPSDSILHGPMGNVTNMVWHQGSSMTVDPSKNASVKAVVYSSAPASGNNHVAVAYARYGNGKVCATGDSSPFDDGTGNPNSTLYTSYATDGTNRNIIMNMTIWLATPNSLAVPNVTGLSESAITVYPNPSSGLVSVRSDNNISKAVIAITDITGKLVLATQPADLAKGTPTQFNLNKGFYFVKVSGEGFEQTNKVVVY